MRKLQKFLPLFLVVSLTACSKSSETIMSKELFAFDSFVSIKLDAGENSEEAISGLEKITKMVDAISDSYKKRDTFGIYELNQTNEKVKISEDLYDLLSWAKEAEKIAPNYNPLVGSLSNKWKEALAKNEVLSKAVIQEELTKINNSSLMIEKNNNEYFAQRVGDALIDLGGIAKGYALDRYQSFLQNEYYSNNEGNYLINAGASSILLGEGEAHKKNEKYYSVKIKDLKKTTYFRMSQSFVSTSGISEQKTIIDGNTYSHIIDPKTGSAVSLYDAVIVITGNEKYGNGALGDALSTSLMMSSLKEIEEVEKSTGFKVIVVKDDDVLYQSGGIELYH